eukprot:CAMPEP_0176471846 /NCGR_PEP_ID=MMETSP0127-20121128/41390_1 /TAXON_ID=938130 /ORGANISM="Platyophrya macrostoma, Strain WH" /LENGTH=287 /DNA_ID=CAMNT_0017866601 /DNA_START=100 /DNA_END=964 /DNA_ORIENTATION=-
MERLAPLKLADTTWDNVGVLVENPKPNGSNRVMLTIDLTPEVLNECLEKRIEVIVAYHPPIFTGLKRLNLKAPKQAIVLRTIAEGMSIYSPHTIVDPEPKSCVPIVPSEPALVAALGLEANTTGMGRLVRLASPIPFSVFVDRVKRGLEVSSVRVCTPKSWGSGRSDAEGKLISTYAVCAGSGTSVFRSLKSSVDVVLSGEMGHHDVLNYVFRSLKSSVDVVLSGEMGHHDVLAAADGGQAVVLCEHTNTERGFLKAKLQPALQLALEDTNVEVLVSSVDHDPLQPW